MKPYRVVLTLLCAAFVWVPAATAQDQAPSASLSPAAADVGADSAGSAPSGSGVETFDWRGATGDSLRLLLAQNLARLFQAKTREGLKGPFFADYWDTLGQKPIGFMDGDSWVTNFLGHPLQGSVTYRLARVSGATRTQAFWWGVAYSTQFELGPLGEAALGNVPISPVDLIVTPVAGFALGVAEEWLAQRLPKRGEQFWLITRSLLLGHVVVRFTIGK